MLKLKDYEGTVDEKVLEKIRIEAKPLEEKHIVHINSTYYGGGVAEMLNSLVPLCNDLGIRTGWRLLKGTPDFFSITKSFHNAIQGAELNLTDIKKQVYEDVNETNALISHLKDHHMIIIHDPQPLPLIKLYKKTQPWLWRCHIDLSNPNKELWEYLKGFISRFDHSVISKSSFKNRIPTPSTIIYPAIDPLSTKNKEIDDQIIDKTLQKFGIDRDKPIISQISRFDKWKDPLGVVEAFKIVRKKAACRLVLLGSMATDDPEGQEIYDKIIRVTKDEKDIHVINFENDMLVNSLQRASSVVIQKSLKEGFGLTVSEALWKKTPVVAGNVGGIPLQVKHKKTGYLVNSAKECAKAVISLLENPKMAQKMGEQGKEHVRKNFLITRQLLDHIGLYKKLLINYKTFNY